MRIVSVRGRASHVDPGPASELALGTFVLLHVPLAYALTFSPWLGTGHALGALLYGLHAALSGNVALVVGVLGYVAGAEVLWRMTTAALPWEFGKYASVLIAGAAAAVECWRQPSAPRRWAWGPIAYFVLLLPAAVPTLMTGDWSRARRDLAFNLSGPLALAVLSTYLWRRQATQGDFGRLLLAIMAPVLGIVFLAVRATVTMPPSFINDSNFVASGGFGPNQVSTMLGLGALLAFVFCLVVRGTRPLQSLVAVMMFGFLAQALLTFSRGWVVSALSAVLVLGTHLLSTRRIRRFLALGAACALEMLVLLPSLNTFTSGQLGQRFTDPSPTGRDELVRGELQAFREHPWLGVGVGLSVTYRDGRATHTEPARMLAEHGILGLIALVVLATVVAMGYRDARPGLARGVTAALVVWGSTVMLHSATRIAAVPLAIAVALMAWHLETDDDDRLREGSSPAV